MEPWLANLLNSVYPQQGYGPQPGAPGWSGGNMTMYPQVNSAGNDWTGALPPDASQAPDMSQVQDFRRMGSLRMRPGGPGRSPSGPSSQSVPQAPPPTPPYQGPPSGPLASSNMEPGTIMPGGADMGYPAMGVPGTASNMGYPAMSAWNAAHPSDYPQMSGITSMGQASPGVFGGPNASRTGAPLPPRRPPGAGQQQGVIPQSTPGRFMTMPMPGGLANRGPGTAPIITALNLQGLFGKRPQAA